MTTTTHKLIAGAAALVIAATSCASTENPENLAATVEAAPTSLVDFELVEPSPDIVGFNDDFEHFVVLVDPDATLEDVNGSTDTAAEADVDPVSELSGDVTIYLEGGARIVDVAEGTLRAVRAENPDEIAALEQHADSTISVIVEDAAGALTNGTPSRYVYTGDGLHTLNGGVEVFVPANSAVEFTPGTDTATNSAAQPTSPAPSGAVVSPLDAAVAAQIIDLTDTVSVEHPSPGMLAVTTGSNGDDIAAVPGVESVFDNVTFSTTGDQYQNYQWALENTGDPFQAFGVQGIAGADIDAYPAWDVATGSGIVVAVIDTGVQLNHPDLAGRFAINTDETCGNGIDDDANGFIDDCNGWDFGDNDATVTPNTASNAGHGTHVAGIIAAGRNGVGVVGVAPDALIMPIKVARPDGVMPSDALVSAVNYAVANGADVINMSLGTPFGIPRTSVLPFANAVSAATAAGVLVVTSAGNETADITNNPKWPASFAETDLGVIAAGASNNSDGRASISNFGGPVSIWAPGEGILSTGVGSIYEGRTGTSMAAPAVAGAAAVLLSTGSYTPVELHAHLVATAQATTAGPRLDLSNAVGANTEAAVSVQYRDVDQMRADIASTIAIDATASNASDVTQMRLSVATIDEGDVMAVSGLSASVTTPTGKTAGVSTDDLGAFPTLPTGSDIVNGATFNATLSLPAGQYAFVTELITGSGTRVGGAQVMYVTISDSGAPTTTNPPSGGGGSGGGGGGGTTNTTTPATGGGGGQTPTVTTQPPSDGGGGGGGGQTPTPTTQPPSGGGGGIPSTTAAPDVPTTSGPPSDGGGGGQTPTVTTQPPSGGNTTTTTTTTITPPATTTPPAGGGGGTTTPTTTPTPDPVTSGEYRLDSMTPRLGDIAGNEVVSITGAFPTQVPVYVWWGDKGTTEAHSNDGTVLAVRTPSVQSSGVVDVIVKFLTSESHELTLQEAFTFHDGDSNVTPPTTTTPGGAPSTTTPGNTTTPTTTAPTTTSTTTPSGTTPTVTTQPPGSGDQPPTTRSRGSLTLRPPASGTALASLSTASWQTSCTTSTCNATDL